jgi:hypothetical protein
MTFAPLNPAAHLRRTAAALLALTLLVGLALTGRAQAAGAPTWHTPTYNGQDYGWPDCAKSVGGQGQPFPPATWNRLLVV